MPCPLVVPRVAVPLVARVTAGPLAVSAADVPVRGAAVLTVATPTPVTAPVRRPLAVPDDGSC